MYRSLAFICLGSLLLTACSQNVRPMPEKSEKQSSPAPATKITVVDPATTATVRGTVHFNGTAPAPVEIDMGMDPGCTLSNPQKNFSQQFAVGGKGALANVYVYIKKGLHGQNFEVPVSPAALDQKGCRYEPHVLALMAGQTL
jgi:hypothetical protein